MKFNNTLLNLVQHDLDNNLIPMLLGEPGIGKSSWVKALGVHMHTKVFVLAVNQLADKADLTGSRLVPITLKDGSVTYEQVFYPHSIISQAIRYAEENPQETPILFMDELNRTTPDVTSEALSIPTMRSIGNSELPKNLKVVCGGNDKGNITSLDEASISRFVLYKVEPDLDTFLGLDDNLNPFIKKVLMGHPECLFCKSVRLLNTQSDDDDDNGEVDLDEILDEGDDIQQFTTPRTITGLSNWLNSFTNDELKGMLAITNIVDGQEVSILQEALEGHTGKTQFTAFLLSEIASGISSVNNQANAVTVGKPNVYDQLKAFQTVSDLDNFVKTMTDNDKSGCLVYAIYEKADNNKLINTLLSNMSNMTSLLPADTRALTNAYLKDSLDDTNLKVFLDNQSPIAKGLSVLMTLG